MRSTHASSIVCQQRRALLSVVGVALCGIGPDAIRVHAAAGPRPNLVWIMAEDIGCDLACYGAKGLQTPVLDRLASEGLMLERLYCTSPICSPNRSAMMTGMHQTSIDAHHHRSHRGDGYRLPAPVRPITAYLQEAGYYCALGCGYGAKTDLNFKPARREPPLFNGRDWSKRGDNQPFFAQIQLRVTHRGDWWAETRAESADPVGLDEIELPPYLPDHPAVREDWATYLDQVERADAQVGEILARLEAEGIADETIVVFIGDNGRCVFRGKGFLYEDGLRVPGIVVGPGLPAGERSDRLVSVIDLSAQILAWAGVEIPVHVQGRPFLEADTRPRRHAFAARDRWDEVHDKSRAVIGPRFKYLRHDLPEIPYFTHQAYLERVRPTRPVLWDLFQRGELTPVQAALMRPTKPAEVLYDLVDDPWETRNLAGEPAHADRLITMRRVLAEWERSTNDLGRTPESPDAIPAKTRALIERRREILESGERQ